MKNLLLAATLAFFGLLSLNANAQNANKTEKVTLECNVHCHSCKAKIMQQLPYEKGVKDVKVDVAKKEIEIEFKSDKNTTDDLIKALKKMGYEASLKKEKEEETEK